MIETNEEYVKAVAEGRWPDHPLLPAEPAFTDERGVITNLLLLDVASVSEIRSTAGSVRANHWHKTDWHFSYVVSGRVLYVERPVGDEPMPYPEARAFKPGDVFFTPPDLVHAMIFPVDTVILTFAKRRRDHDSHEDDVVRVDFVSPEQAQRYIDIDRAASER